MNDECEKGVHWRAAGQKTVVAITGECQARIKSGGLGERAKEMSIFVPVPSPFFNVSPGDLLP